MRHCARSARLERPPIRAPRPTQKVMNPLAKPIRRARRVFLVASVFAGACSAILAMSGQIGPVDALVLAVFLCFFAFLFILAAPALGLESDGNQ